MAEFETCVIPFPLRYNPLREAERSPHPTEAAAELRATMLSNLLDSMAEPEGPQAQDLRSRINAMVVLYRRALSEARGGAQ